jgi:Mlc titration factor MtfA (ptsG expression regulator)
MPQDSSTVPYPIQPDTFINTEPSEPNLNTHSNTLEELPAMHTEPFIPGSQLIFSFLTVFAFITYRVLNEVRKDRDNGDLLPLKGTYSSGEPIPAFRYEGDELRFTDNEYENILSAHSSFFKSLDAAAKEKFINRISRFIAEKIFFIHSSETFKEMPVLVAASAIQLSFGLDKYLFPHFKYFHIYREEFLRTQPVLCFLEGNVSGHSIRLSWKHLLQGIENNSDGNNVGLHEMAHALYYQTFVTGRNIDIHFRDFFDKFNDDGNKVYQIEQALDIGLYSRYAMKNFQEFWAESVEIFFEKPILLAEKYPDLFESMKKILNQHPS